MKSIVIVCPRQNLIFGNIAQALCISFMELGWISICVETREEIKAIAKDMEYALVITPHDYPDIRSLLPNSKIILYQTEVLPWLNQQQKIVSWLGRKCDENWRHLKLLLNNYDIVVDYDKNNIEHNLKYSYSNRKAGFLPVGYSPIFELNEKAVCNNAVLLIGNTTERRRQIFNTILRPDYRVQWLRNKYQNDALRLIKGAAINLNIHIHNLPMFESPRIVQQIFANKGFVISEPCKSAGEFKDRIHWGMAASRFFPDMIRFYLKRPDLRLQIADNAYNFVTKHYTMTQRLEQVFREIGI